MIDSLPIALQVRASVVCRGASAMIQVASWFMESNKVGVICVSRRFISDLSSYLCELTKYNIGSKRFYFKLFIHLLLLDQVVNLITCRVKNMFALEQSEVSDGYRDLKVFLIFKDSQSGLGIIGEIQVSGNLQIIKHYHFLNVELWLPARLLLFL
jgi:hypothetical protein